MRLKWCLYLNIFHLWMISLLNFSKKSVLLMLYFQLFKELCGSVKKLSKGSYGIFWRGEIREDVQKILDTCPMTNLTAERLFGDLDYDMNKHKRASLNLRSTTIMWKRNDTTAWFNSLIDYEQRELMEKKVEKMLTVCMCKANEM